MNDSFVLLCPKESHSANSKRIHKNQIPHMHIRYMYSTCQKKGCELVAILRDYFVETKSQTHRDCIIAKFANSVNTMRIRMAIWSAVYCAHFANFANVSTRIARTLREHTLLAHLREVFACVSLPFFFNKYRTFIKPNSHWVHIN